MKNDLFNGKIKRQYIGYIWFSIILGTAIFMGTGALLLFTVLQRDPGSADWNVLLGIGIFFCLIGFVFFFGELFVIRSYPKSQKYIKWFLNSDCYFVDNDSKNYYGTWKGKRAFDLITASAEQNRGMEGIQYPKKCKVYTALAFVGIALMFVYLGIAYAAIENLDKLPVAIQKESFIFAALTIAEVLDVFISFTFAFRVRKIKKEAVRDYIIKHRENKKTANEK